MDYALAAMDEYYGFDYYMSALLLLGGGDNAVISSYVDFMDEE